MNLQLGPIQTITHPQGSEGWLSERALPGTCCASEAPAVMNCSPHLKRDELVAKMAVGHEKEFSQFVRDRILARGHANEAKARVLLEEDLGEELAPLTLWRTVDGMRWLASLDGQTMAETTLMEHKDWNLDIVAHIELHGEPPIDKCFQMEHQLLVADAQVVIFICSDGTRENRARCDYTSKPERRAALIAGWKQLLLDAANFVAPPAAAPAPVPKVIQQHAALTCSTEVVEGKLVVRTNLDVVKPAYLAYIAAIPTTLETDQQFLDAKVDAAYCRESAAKLELAVEMLLGQLVDVQKVKASVEELVEAFTKKAIGLENAVTTQNQARRTEKVMRGVNEFKAHIDSLNAQLGKPYMPAIANDFPGAAKGKRNLASTDNAINAHLADCKIRANEVFAGINKNLIWLRENAADYKMLFADVATLALRPHADMVEVAQARIAAHKAEEERKAAAVAAAAAEAERQRLAKVEEERVAEAARAAAPPPTPAPTPAPTAAPTTEARYPNGAPVFGQQVKENGDRIMLNPEGGRSVFCDVDEGESQPLQKPAPTATVVPIRPVAPKAAPSVSITALNEALGLNVTSGLLERLQFPAASIQGKAGKFYSPDDLPAIARAIAQYLIERAEFFEQADAA